MKAGLGKRVFVTKIVTDVEVESLGSFITSTTQISAQKKVDFIVSYLGSGVAESDNIKVGDRVFLGMYTQEPMNIGGEMLLVVKIDDIIAIL
jgi:co-chaperonin GroES (HSP10)